MMRLSHKFFLPFFSTPNIEKWSDGGGKESHSAINSRILNFAEFFSKEAKFVPYFNTNFNSSPVNDFPPFLK